VQHGPIKRRSDQLMEMPHQNGRLIVNADDWGRDRHTTDRILECVVHKALSSASAMVFMEDCERAAAMDLERGIDCGLHLNFTAPFRDVTESKFKQADVHRWYLVTNNPTSTSRFFHAESTDSESGDHNG
jgi:hypothetical protein